MNEFEGLVKQHLLQSAEVKRLLVKTAVGEILEAVDLIVSTLENDGKLMLCGNGGSAADCQHIAAEFVSVLRQDFTRPALPAIALTTDTSFLTANANDFGFGGVFVRQVQALGQKGDVLIGLSTSGNSENVVRGMSQAKDLGLKTIAFTGNTGGSLVDLVDINIRVPSDNVQYIQEAHIAIGHIICALVETKLFF